VAYQSPEHARAVVGVVSEQAADERRVALDPDASGRLTRAGHGVLVESGAGTGASFPDAAYAAAGAEVVDRVEVLQRCDVLAVVRPPAPDVVATLRAGQTLLGLVDPAGQP